MEGIFTFGAPEATHCKETASSKGRSESLHFSEWAGSGVDLKSDGSVFLDWATSDLAASAFVCAFPNVRSGAVVIHRDTFGKALARTSPCYRVMLCRFNTKACGV